jgi:predicted GIY-YIG superfamily endonuclease
MEGVKVAKAIENNVVLYFHKNATTGEIFYVGIGLKRRAYNWKDRSVFWKRYVNKYGLPTVVIIAKNLTREEAIYWEKAFIKIFGRRGLDSNGILVNRTIGGEGVTGIPMPEEAKRHLSILNKGKKMPASHGDKIAKGQQGRKLSEEWRKNLSESKKGKKNPAYGKPPDIKAREKAKARTGEKNPNFGKKHSPELREKMRLARIGVHARGEHHKAKKVIDIQTGKTYNCIKDAASDANVRYENLVRYLTGDRPNKTNIRYLN